MILSIIFVSVIILGIGLPLVLILTPRQHPAAILGVSYALGMGIFTFVMFLTNIAGLKFTFFNELILLLLITVPLVLLKKKELGKFFTEIVHSPKKLHLSPVEKIMLGALAYVIISSFINTLYWPVYLWDSLNLYDFRAHIFALTGFMKYGLTDGYYIGYPLLTSLAQTLVFLFGGLSSQFLHSLFYLSLGAGFYGFLREFVSRKIGLLFTLILLITGPLFYHSLISYTNLSYTVYVFLGAICVYLWDKRKRIGYLILSALLTSLSTWTRSVEPFWLAIFFVVFIVAVYRKKFWDIIIFSLCFFPIHEAWKVFQSSLINRGTSTVGEVLSYTKIASSLLDTSRWMQIAGYLYKYVVVPWGAIFLVFLLSVVSLFLIKQQKQFFLIFFVTFSLLGVMVLGTFAFSMSYLGTFAIGDAAQRLSMLFYPLFAYCIAIVLQEAFLVKK